MSAVAATTYHRPQLGLSSGQASSPVVMDTRYSRMTESELQTELDKATTYDERKKIRAALRSVKGSSGVQRSASMMVPPTTLRDPQSSTVDYTQIESTEELEKLLDSTRDYFEKMKIRSALDKLLAAKKLKPPVTTEPQAKVNGDSKPCTTTDCKRPDANSESGEIASLEKMLDSTTDIGARRALRSNLRVLRMSRDESGLREISPMSSPQVESTPPNAKVEIARKIPDGGAESQPKPLLKPEVISTRTTKSPDTTGSVLKGSETNQSNNQPGVTSSETTTATKLSSNDKPIPQTRAAAGAPALTATSPSSQTPANGRASSGRVIIVREKDPNIGKPSVEKSNEQKPAVASKVMVNESPQKPDIRPSPTQNTGAEERKVPSFSSAKEPIISKGPIKESTPIAQPPAIGKEPIAAKQTPIVSSISSPSMNRGLDISPSKETQSALPSAKDDKPKPIHSLPERVDSTDSTLPAAQVNSNNETPSIASSARSKFEALSKAAETSNPPPPTQHRRPNLNFAERQKRFATVGSADISRDLGQAMANLAQPQWTQPPTSSPARPLAKSQEPRPLSVAEPVTAVQYDDTGLNYARVPKPAGPGKTAPECNPQRTHKTSIIGIIPRMKMIAKLARNNVANVKAQLLDFCRVNTAGYKGVDVQNFSSSWSDGLAFCALIHHFYPDAFDFSRLRSSNRRENFELAFSTAETRGGISPLLDVEDMIIMGDKPDWKCVYTYVQSCQQKLRTHELNQQRTREPSAVHQPDANEN